MRADGARVKEIEPRLKPRSESCYHSCAELLSCARFSLSSPCQITDEAMRVMRGRKADRDMPQLWAIQQLREAGLTVCPMSKMPLADVGRPGRETLDTAFWAMLVDTAKAHEACATVADRTAARVAAVAYHKALKEEEAAAKERYIAAVEEPLEEDDEEQPPREDDEEQDDEEQPPEADDEEQPPREDDEEQPPDEDDEHLRALRAELKPFEADEGEEAF